MRLPEIRADSLRFSQAMQGKTRQQRLGVIHRAKSRQTRLLRPLCRTQHKSRLARSSCERYLCEESLSKLKS
jgi:hypothetical protein